MIGLQFEMISGNEQTGFTQGGSKFFARDLDVGDVETVLGEFGTEDDETPMTVGGSTVLGTLGEEALRTLRNKVAEFRIKHSGEGSAHV